MNYTINFNSWEGFRSSLKDREVFWRSTPRKLSFEIPEIMDETNFPVWFKAHNRMAVLNGENIEDGTAIKFLKVPYRAYNGTLFREQLEEVCGIPKKTIPGLQFLKTLLEKKIATRFEGEKKNNARFYNEESIVVQPDNNDEIAAYVMNKVADYVIFNRHLWKKTPEPRYLVLTYGRGDNAETGLFLQTRFNPFVGSEHYFNAREREKALAFFDKEVSEKNTRPCCRDVKIIVCKGADVRVNPRIQHFSSEEKKMSENDSGQIRFVI